MQSPSMRVVPESGTGHSPVVMTFGEAMAAVLNRAKVTRKAWQNPDEYLFLRAGILHIHKADDTEHVLSLSDGDLAGEDWIRI